MPNPNRLDRPLIARLLELDRSARAAAEAVRAARAVADARIFRGVNRTPSITCTGEIR